MWDHLVSLYEGQLATGALRAKDEEFGALLQVAMVHWRMRGQSGGGRAVVRARCASSSPRTPGCCPSSASGARRAADTARLAPILSDAQRAMPRGRSAPPSWPRLQSSRGGRNAQKAIEQWRTRPPAGSAQQAGARRPEAPLPADGELERADRSCSARSSTRSRRTTPRRGSLVLREVADDLPRSSEERLGAGHGARRRSCSSTRTDLDERARARPGLRGAPALARPPHDAGAAGGARAASRA